MKRLLLILGIALAFVACEKEDSGEDLDKLLYANSGYVKLSQNYVVFDKETGGSITIYAEEDAFVGGLGRYVGAESEIESLYDIQAPEYILTLEQILKYKEFVTDGCKIVPDGFRKFTITVEPNCGYDLYEICIVKIVETKKYGKVGGYGGNNFQVIIK